MKFHKDLDVWQLAVELATDIYVLTKTFPKDELYGMTSQMRRSSSIARNIAEGAARQKGREFNQFLHYAMGSAAELDTHLEISMRVNLAAIPVLKELQVKATRIGQMLRGLTRALRNKDSA